VAQTQLLALVVTARTCKLRIAELFWHVDNSQL